MSLVNVEFKLFSLYITHVRRFLNKEVDCKWKDLTNYFFGIQLRLYKPNQSINLCPHSVVPSAFYKNVKEALSKVRQVGALDIVQSTSKVVYSHLVSSIDRPRVQRLFPSVDFSRVWSNVSSRVVSPSIREMMWRSAHQVLSVNVVLYKRNISKFVHCYFCRKPESIEHLFVSCSHVVDLWLFVELLLSKMSLCRVRLGELSKLFQIFPAALPAKFRPFALILISELKGVVWSVRCNIKHQKGSFQSDRLLNLFKASVNLHCMADYARLSFRKFSKRWPAAFCKAEGKRVNFFWEL